MIAVAGMHRSGTSCVTGLLERCGLSLGTTHPLLNEPRFDNPKGHFENLSVVAINEMILRGAGGTWSSPPPEEGIARSGIRVVRSIVRFSDKFDGVVVKDPRLSLTLSVWERSTPKLKAVVVCLRNPIGVADSLARRDGFALADSLSLWFQYNSRLVMGVSRSPLIVVDYDEIGRNTAAKMAGLVRLLGRPMSEEEVACRIDGFYTPELNHDPSSERHLQLLPDPVKCLYDALRGRAFRPERARVPSSPVCA